MGINVALTLLGSLVGTILSLILPKVARTRQYKKRADLLGKWHSKYQFYQDEHQAYGRWITEDVEVDLHGPKFRLRNSNNEIADYYVAEGTLSHRTDLLGDWESVQRDAYASGAFMLTIMPMGGILYGYFTGPRDTGERVYGAWVLARKKEDLDKGVRLLQLCRLDLQVHEG